jgi:hypothetical protein
MMILTFWDAEGSALAQGYRPGAVTDNAEVPPSVKLWPGISPAVEAKLAIASSSAGA